MAKLTAQQRILKAHMQIMGHKKWCGYSALLATGKVDVTDRVPTACTDGWNVRYGKEFIDGLNDAEVRALVLHENTHKAYRHLQIYKHLSDENAKLANIAMDHFVNLYLSDVDNGEGFVAIPEIGIQPNPRFRGMSTQQIYDILKQEQDGRGKGDDENDERGDGQGDGNEPGDGDEQGGGLDEHDWKGAADNGDGMGDMPSVEEQAKQIEDALRQGEIIHRQKNKGNGTGGAEGSLGSLLAPKVDWRELLKQFIRTTCKSNQTTTWRKPNRRYLSQDIYLPSAHGKTMKHLVIGWDTSGSCFNSAEMTAFVAELGSIMKEVSPKRVTVVYWDTKVTGWQEFKDGKFALQSVKPVGGGGTDAAALFDWLRAERMVPDAVVNFTDGYVGGDWGRADCPVLWGITSKHISAPFGQTVHVEV